MRRPPMPWADAHALQRIRNCHHGRILFEELRVVDHVAISIHDLLKIRGIIFHIRGREQGISVFGNVRAKVFRIWKGIIDRNILFARSAILG